jgi:hypothetical protein
VLRCGLLAGAGWGWWGGGVGGLAGQGGQAGVRGLGVDARGTGLAGL